MIQEIRKSIGLFWSKSSCSGGLLLAENQTRMQCSAFKVVHFENDAERKTGRGL